MATKKLWGGGYGKATASIVERFTESVSYDKRLAPFDIQGSIVHAEMLGRKKIIPAKDAKKIVAGLKAIGREIESGRFKWNEKLEDVHMNIESALTARIGDAGARLHTGRSRNDQVATAFRLYCADAGKRLEKGILDLVEALQTVSAKAGRTILPGYTHLQQAQPVTIDAWLAAYEVMMRRDLVRFLLAGEMTMYFCPLGAGALAGSTLPLDRKWTAKRLGFRMPNDATMDAVSDRDFALELLFACAVTQVHLSRLAEDLIIYSSKEFGFIKLDDSVTTGSSLMPQKKNPDVCELTRGKTGRVIGNLVSLLVTLKGLPMTYNRDLQEDKERVFDSVDTTLMSLAAMALVVRTMTVDAKRCEEVIDPTMLATDLAEHLVEQGVPFRHAHEIIARLVHGARKTDHVAGIGDFGALTEADLAAHHPALKGAKKRLSPREAIRRRKL